MIREEPTYKFGALVSDIGGALGLICGLSILDLLIFVTNFVKKVINNSISLFRGLTIRDVSLSVYKLSFM